ncbi:histidine kinase [Microbacterium sp. Marseille-Q6965]|uniref:histidine kinase n=1 Tax=Microbacterium sp. Marseille-Q6965 TaxID=2965072 RepID=UPI0021B77967|nr:histidine kinase [Microbacterium sp. Marseille-Q6965]
MTTPSPAPLPARLAAALLALEALALLVLAGWQVVAMLGGDTTSLPTALALLVFTLVGAAGVGAFAYAVVTDRSWGRSGGIVTQLLVLAVALGALTGQYGHPLVALGLAVPAVVGLVLIARAAKAAAPGVER